MDMETTLLCSVCRSLPQEAFAHPLHDSIVAPPRFPLRRPAENSRFDLGSYRRIRQAASEGCPLCAIIMANSADWSVTSRAGGTPLVPEEADGGVGLFPSNSGPGISVRKFASVRSILLISTVIPKHWGKVHFHFGDYAQKYSRLTKANRVNRQALACSRHGQEMARTMR